MEDMFDFEIPLAKTALICSDADKKFFNFEGIKIFSENDDLEENLQDADLIFIVTENNLQKIIDCAKKNNALTIAFAENAVENVDAYCVVKDLAVIAQIVKAVTDLVSVPGLVNLDIDDIKALLKNSGRAFVGLGEAEGENSVIESMQNAINNIGSNISNSKAALMNITGSPENFSMEKINDATNILQESIHPDAEIIWGVSTDDDFGDKIQVIIIASNIADK